MRVQISGSNLKEIRLKREISQTQLAANIGCSKASISKIELAGGSRTSEHTLKSMAMVLNCSEGYLMGNTSDPVNYISNDRDRCMQRLNAVVGPLSDERLEIVVDIVTTIGGGSDRKLKTILNIIKAILKTI